jgi:acetoin utilization protein AcuB
MRLNRVPATNAIRRVAPRHATPPASPVDRVLAVMSRPLVTVSPDTEVGDAEWIATDERVHHLLVTERDQLIGIVCVHDLHAADPTALVRDCMSAPVIGIGCTASVHTAADVMRRYQVSCLPVVAQQDVLGVVTHRDLVRAGAESADWRGELCAACGSDHHVRMDPRTGGAWFCLDCLERAHPPEPGEDVGVGD